MKGEYDRVICAANNLNLLPRPRAVIFDWNNTLVDTYEILLDPFNQTCQHFGRPNVTSKTLMDNRGQTFFSSFPHFFDRDAEDAQLYFEEIMASLDHQHPMPFPGAYDLLMLLKEKKIYTALCSNKKQDLLKTNVHHLQWMPFFQKIIGADGSYMRKPSPEPLLAALQGSGHPPGHHIWFVGDSEVDALCAQKSGVMFVSVYRALEKKSHIIDAVDCMTLLSILRHILSD